MRRQSAASRARPGVCVCAWERVCVCVCVCVCVYVCVCLSDSLTLSRSLSLSLCLPLSLSLSLSLSPSSGPSGVLEPFYVLDESAASGCKVPAPYIPYACHMIKSYICHRIVYKCHMKCTCSIEAHVFQLMIDLCCCMINIAGRLVGRDKSTLWHTSAHIFDGNMCASGNCTHSRSLNSGNLVGGRGCMHNNVDARIFTYIFAYSFTYIMSGVGVCPVR